MRGKHTVQVIDTRFVSTLMNDVGGGFGFSTGRDLLLLTCPQETPDIILGLDTAWEAARMALTVVSWPQT
jgi:hypothetical protein